MDKMIEHTFTCPVRVCGILVAEIDMIAVIEVTSTGYRGSLTQPPEDPEWEIEMVYLYDIDNRKELVEADEYMAAHAEAYLATSTAQERVIEDIRSGDF